MGLSKSLKLKILNLSEKKMSQLIKMTIEDKVSFREIKNTFNFTPGETEKILLKELGEKRFRRWKIRQQKRSTKKTRPIQV